MKLPSSIKNISAFLALAVPLHASAQQADIVQIYGQFVQTSYAASRCSTPDQSVLSSFLKNFEIVSVRVSEELKKRSPGQSEQQIAAKVKEAAGAVEKAIDEVIRTNSCSDPRIQDLLKRFEMQANMKLE